MEMQKHDVRGDQLKIKRRGRSHRSQNQREGACMLVRMVKEWCALWCCQSKNENENDRRENRRAGDEDKGKANCEVTQVTPSTHRTHSEEV